MSTIRQLAYCSAVGAITISACLSSWACLGACAPTDAIAPSPRGEDRALEVRQATTLARSASFPGPQPPTSIGSIAASDHDDGIVKDRITVPFPPPRIASSAVVAGSSARAEPEYPARAASEALDRLRPYDAIRQERRGSVITLTSDELMDPGGWALTSSATYRLDELARALREQFGHMIVIEGYTDAKGVAAANEAVSLRRAEAIRDYFVTCGVPSGWMSVAGLGSRKPVAENTSSDGRARNRRIEIVIRPAISGTPR